MSEATSPHSMLIHASCVAITGKAVLITGPSGAGKSDLALRLIDGGAELVADDQTQLHVENGALIASPPASIAGLMEVRHIGLLRLSYVLSVPVVLIVECTRSNEELERLPETTTANLLGCAIRTIKLPAFAASTPAKIRAVLAYDAAS